MRHFTDIRYLCGRGSGGSERNLRSLMFLCIVGGMASGCGADYVYLQKGKSETEVRQDYTSCAERQQVQFSSGGADGQQALVLDTSRCMESKGYRAVKIERRKA